MIQRFEIKPSVDGGEQKPDLNRKPLYYDSEHGITFRQYQSEADLHEIVTIISKDLSEPYSLYTFRYFIYNWPDLCLLAIADDGAVLGTVVCKLDFHGDVKQGYIAMLAVEKAFRRMGIGSKLVQFSLDLMVKDGVEEVVLETEVQNKPALALYERLGFCRDKYLFRYYLTGSDAYRLKLWIDPRPPTHSQPIEPSSHSSPPSPSHPHPSDGNEQSPSNSGCE